MFNGSVFFEGDQEAASAALTAASQFANIVRLKKESLGIGSLMETVQLFPGVWVSVLDGEHAQSMTIYANPNPPPLDVPVPERRKKRIADNYVYAVLMGDRATTISRLDITAPDKPWEEIVEYPPNRRPTDPVFTVASGKVFYVLREVIESGYSTNTVYTVRRADDKKFSIRYDDWRLINITAGGKKVYVLAAKYSNPAKRFEYKIDVYTFDGDFKRSFYLGTIDDDGLSGWFEYYRGSLHAGFHIDDKDSPIRYIRWDEIDAFVANYANDYGQCTVATCRYVPGESALRIMTTHRVNPLSVQPWDPNVLAAELRRQIINAWFPNQPPPHATAWLAVGFYRPRVPLRGSVGSKKLAESYDRNMLVVRTVGKDGVSGPTAVDFRRDSALLAPLAKPVLCRGRLVVLSTQGLLNSELRIYKKNSYSEPKILRLNAPAALELEVDRDWAADEDENEVWEEQ